MTAPAPAEDQPTSAPAVAAHLSMTDDPGAADKLAPYVAAVNALVPRMARGPAAAVSLGATMLAARLYRRRNSPEGVATFTSEGAMYVQRKDPDVGLLLGLGSNAPPVVG